MAEKARVGAMGRLAHYFRVTIWLGEPPPGAKGFAVRALRIATMIFEGFSRLGLFRTAAGLAFVCLLTVLPLALTVMSLLKGIGALTPVMNSLRPTTGFAAWVKSEIASFAAMEDSSALGIAGAALLALLVLFLLIMLERCFNQMWGVRRGRPILRRVTVYWTLGTAGVIFGFISIACGILLYGSAMHEVPERSGMWSAALMGSPLLLAVLIFTLAYLYVPNTHIRWGSALVGGVVGGGFFEVFKHAGLILASGASEMSGVQAVTAVALALLGGLYLSWVSALVGGQVVYAAQHVQTHRRDLDLPTASVEAKERVSLRAVLLVCRAFMKGVEGPTVEELATSLKVPLRMTSQVVYQLIAMGILRELARTEKRGTGLVPARDPAQITVKNVIDAVRQYGSGTEGLAEDARTLELEDVVQRARGRAEGALDRVTLRDLSDESRPPAAGAKTGKVGQASRDE